MSVSEINELINWQLEKKIISSALAIVLSEFIVGNGKQTLVDDENNKKKLAIKWDAITFVLPFDSSLFAWMKFISMLSTKRAHNVNV